jgi:hypothetical protein
MLILINFFLFQVAWFACVLGAARGSVLLGPAVVGVVFAVHLVLNRPYLFRESALAAGALVCGFVFDSLCVAFRVHLPVREIIPEPFTSVWLLALWVNFATTLNVSLRSIARRPLIAALLGMLGGPLAYLAGQKLGALQFGLPLPASLAVIGVGWAFILPGLYSFSRMLDR